MAATKHINWESKEVVEILNNNTLSLDSKSKMLGVSVWWVCKQMKRIGVKHNPYWKTGLDRPSTNKERKARYNAKRKEIGWKYLYQVQK